LATHWPWTYGPPCTGCMAHRVAPTFIMFVANFSPFTRRGCPLPSTCSR
jgi:hypothetical protein